MFSTAVRIIDATLREGNQTPNVQFSVGESVRIAEALQASGVDAIECGHPSASPLEFERARAVAGALHCSDVLVHARAHPQDITSAAKTGAKWVGIFCGINEISLITRLQNWTVERVLENAQAAVRLAKANGLRVRFTLEDSSRTEPELGARLYDAVISAGADRICFSDTVGILEPPEVASRLAELKRQFPGIPLEAHFHDDRGLALANALAAVDVGADWVSTSMNGMGERCGVVDTTAFVANITVGRRARAPHRYKLPQLVSLSRYVSIATRTPVDARRPVIGEYAFTHTAKLHQRAVHRDASAYSWVPAEEVGRHLECRPKIPVPSEIGALVLSPLEIPATELKHHRTGPGTRYVMIDHRLLPDCRQYCIVRRIWDHPTEPGAGHVDEHAHTVDSLFMFIGEHEDMSGLEVEVSLNGKTFSVSSPRSVFIPAGVIHKYRVVSGRGYYVNHVLAGDYNSSLMDCISVPSQAVDTPLPGAA